VDRPFGTLCQLLVVGGNFLTGRNGFARAILPRSLAGDAHGVALVFAGIDHTGADHLTKGEFCEEDKANGDLDKTGRAARLPLNGDTGEPLLSGGLWKADAVYRLPIGNIQGAVSYDGKWYLSRSRGATNGVLYVTKPISTATGTLQIGTAHHAGVRPEDLSHWPKPDGSPGDLWTVTEYPGKRLLYVCDIGRLNDTDRLDEIYGRDPSPPN
jgi:hypothetical protein